MVKAEAEYKSKYISILRDPGDASLVSELVREFCAKYAPQLVAPSRFVVCNDYAEFSKRIKGKSDHPVNAANIISAIYSTYFSPRMESMQSMPATIASAAMWQPHSAAIMLPEHNTYEMLDVQFSFEEPTRISALITRSNSIKGVCTFDWLSGLAFDEMRQDYFNNAPSIEFHGILCVLARNCFAFWQKGEDFVVCAKANVNLDFRYRVHHDTRKAVQFPSGDGFYALRGVRIDEKYITRPVSGKDLMKERNAEVRMVLLEKYGTRLLDDIPHKVVSERGKVLFTRLIEMSWDGYEKIRMLHLKWKDKDGRIHETLIHVPATGEEFGRLGQSPPKNIDDCEEMRRWVMRLSPEDVLVKET